MGNTSRSKRLVGKRHGNDGGSDDAIENMSVRRLMTEMKDISEVVVDLAYATLMYNSEDMAKSVDGFIDRMEELKYAIRTKVMLSARTRDDAKQLSGILQVASAADKISHEAGEIAKLLNVPPEKRPFIPLILNESDEKIAMTTISETSDMAGNTIGHLMVEAKTGMKIIALKNRQGWTYDPDGKVKLRSGDIILVRGTDEGFKRLAGFAQGTKRWEFSSEGQ